MQTEASASRSRMNCPLCDSESKYIFSAKGFPIHDCVACHHRFAAIYADETHPAQIYDDNYFFGGGAGYSNYLMESEILIGRGKKYAGILQRYTARKGKMLDVGAAAGFLMKGFQSEGWQTVGLEPNEKMMRFGREKSGLDIRQGALEKFETEEKFDLITIIQVTGHFFNPRRAFENAHKLLKKNGLLLVETWNRDSLSARMFGKNWHEYSPPSVLHFFSEKGLTAFLDKIGFEKIAHRKTFKKISGAHAKSLLTYRLGKHFLFRLIPEKICFPYPGDDLFWAIFQKKQKQQ